MESPYLTTASDFWSEAEANTVLLNPRLPAAAEVSAPLAAAADAAGLFGHIVFATSGTTGNPKFACLSRRALLASAKAVNQHLQVSEADRWFCALPSFHVGGLGIWARAYSASIPVTMLRGRWDAAEFVSQIDAVAATLTSVVPTQVHDLVRQGEVCPKSMRAVLVGGGALAPDLRAKAEALGWPLLETFGMTESASQIATEFLHGHGSFQNAGLPILPIWEARLSLHGVLEIRGTALFSGYLVRSHVNSGFTFSSPISRDGWFVTSDRVELVENGRCLIPKTRADSVVKVFGENVDTKAVQMALNALEITVVVVALADPRSGKRLVAVIDREAASDVKKIEQALAAYNRTAVPPERVNQLAIVPIIPTSELGKVADHQVISALLHMNNFRNIN
ncbi:MAG: AMP-binding protein [Verrucomicrobiae bacterium]|nr:AMP-binding protein [Verrucomicrobiae bacterium]